MMTNQSPSWGRSVSALLALAFVLGFAVMHVQDGGRFLGQVPPPPPAPTGYCCDSPGSMNACTQETAADCTAPSVYVAGTTATELGMCQQICGSSGQAVCGDTKIQTGEGCDDGNTMSGDGCSDTCQAEAPLAGAANAVCSDSLDNDGDSGVDSNDYGCYVAGVYTPAKGDETDPTCPYEYTMTVNAHVWVDDMGSSYKSGGSPVSCISPGGGFEFVSSSCFVTGAHQDGDPCWSIACLYKRPTQRPLNYVITHWGNNVKRNTGSQSCANYYDFPPSDNASRPPAGYNLKYYGCLITDGPDVPEHWNANVGLGKCLSDLCLWEKSGVTTASDLQMLSFGGPPYQANAGCVATTNPGVGYKLNSQACTLSLGRNGYAPCSNSVCLWEKTAKTELCLAPITCGNGAMNPPEECDDGNQTDGDGCSSMCRNEAPTPPDQPPPGATHTACSGVQCVSVAGAGTDQCAVDADCTGASHNACVADNVCSVLPGPGTSVCSANVDCSDMHLTCVGLTCQGVPGPGTDDCSLDPGDTTCSQNQHLVCGNNQCLVAIGPGVNECASAADCARTQHLACTGGNTCAIVQGPGMDQCSNGADCPLVCGDRIIVPPEQCDDGNTLNGDGCSATCQTEGGSGGASSQNGGGGSAGPGSSASRASAISRASTATSRITTSAVSTRSAVSSRMASSVRSSASAASTFSFGGSGGSAGSQTSRVTHAACRNGRCLEVSGPGSAECSNNADCQEVHAECRSNQCVVMAGSGPDRCQLDEQCETTHAACRDNQCVTVAGPGATECSDNADCSAAHAECRANACVAVIGPGGDTCSTSWDCTEFSLCGNAVVEGSEVCDDGNRDETDACTSSCLLPTDASCQSHDDCGTGLCVGGSCILCNRDAECGMGACVTRSCTKEIAVIASRPKGLCSNGAVDANEECDDGNAVPGDGCSSACLLERGMCGDNIVQRLLNEQCEPGLPSILTCNSSCRFVLQYCGNGTIDTGEECDDGPRNANTAAAECHSDCTKKACGDAILSAGEACDDGNLAIGDGCSASCQVERGAPQTLPAQIIDLPLLSNENQWSNNGAEPTTGGDAGGGGSQAGGVQQGTSHAPVGDTGPAAVGVVAAGAAAGWAWVRRRRFTA